MKYKNPIISGFNPDPSICRVGDDFYLVTSTFEFFPGVPIYHSKNLVNWELINYCLTDDEQLPLRNVKPSGGIYAPTIRYHDGTFFMVTTNVTHGGNFIVHTKDIRGKWSKPAWVKQKGIDPSLYWDEDGVCYFMSTASDDEIPKRGIYLSTVDPFTGEMLSPSRLISTGCGGRSYEAPHIYKRGGWYYLMLAEGGTEYGHVETMQRSRNIYGPYEPAPHNPILTHRHLRNPIQATGHADIVEDQNGNWWLVCLGIRPIIPWHTLHNLGRETFLSPVIWNDEGWPVVGNNGTISLEMDGPLPGPAPTKVCRDFIDDFEGDELDNNWNFVRNPDRERYLLANSAVTLKAGDETISDPKVHPTMIVTRQKESNMQVTADMRGDISRSQCAGISVFYNEDYHYDILITHEDDGYYVCLRKHVADIELISARQKIDYKGDARLRVESAPEWYTFFYESDGAYVELGRGMTAPICTECTHTLTFTGTFFGIFSEGGDISFDRFSAKVMEQ